VIPECRSRSSVRLAILQLCALKYDFLPRNFAETKCTISRTGEGWPRADVPYLRMRGRWLERVGFAIGRSVKVEVSDRRLIIEPVD
jgi:toxic protein SymE